MYDSVSFQHGRVSRFCMLVEILRIDSIHGEQRRRGFLMMSEYERIEHQEIEEAVQAARAEERAGVLGAVAGAVTNEEHGLNLPEGYCVINMAALKRQFPELRMSVSAARRI